MSYYQRAVPRSDDDLKKIAKRSRNSFSDAQGEYIDVFSCLSAEFIWTVKSQRRLVFMICPDSEMGDIDGSTLCDDSQVIIKVKQSVADNARFGEGRARNTLIHELAHGVLMHEGAPKHRKTGISGSTKPKWMKTYEDPEHQVKVFTAAFLIDDTSAETANTPEEVAERFGVSLESAKIYFQQLIEKRNRPESIQRVERMADAFRHSVLESKMAPRYLDEFCPNCGKQTMAPVGVKLHCESCGHIGDLPDGDS